MGEKTRAFTLFATHYFELTALAGEITGAANVHLDAVEHKGELVFLHAVKPGPANQSYGLQVAALAGVPPEVIRRARTYLASLEAGRRSAAGPQAELEFDLPDVARPEPPDGLRGALTDIDPDALSPRAALDTLYALKKLV
jgi:DNA mismatch repair protein MutS